MKIKVPEDPMKYLNEIVRRDPNEMVVKAPEGLMKYTNENSMK